MSDCYTFHEGTSPLLISVPHDGRQLTAGMSARMTTSGLAIPDTDWHVARLYEFVHGMNASMIVANYSRYVVDLNRPSTDDELYPGQVATGLCPLQTFAGDEIYADGAGVSDVECRDRVENYWRPYHERISSELDRLVREYGRALLWDAHSIPSIVPRLFEGELPILNLGTWNGRSCDGDMESAVAKVAGESGFESVVNGRFKGGYITRHYGAPAAGVHAMQLEIAQRVYMDEGSRTWDEDRASRLKKTLKTMLEAFTIQPH